MARYLAIDYGHKRSGLAVSDPTFTIAQKLKTITFKSIQQLINEIKQITGEYQIIKIILGLPLNLKGQDSEKTREVRSFAKKLTAQLSVPIVLFDERFSTARAEQVLHLLGKKPSRSRDYIDQLAAQDILQTYLDQEKSKR
jgi:putative Holliday junction resolvase